MTKRSIVLCTVVAVLHACTATGSDIEIGGGQFSVGGTLDANTIRVADSAEIGGTGTIVGDLTVEGAVDPALCTTSPASLLIQGTATFVTGSTFRCCATTHTACDRLNVEGRIEGECTVIPTKKTDAIPFETAIIAALTGVYDNFSLALGCEREWRLERGPGDLLLTQMTGDSDDNSLPDWFELKYFSVRVGVDPGGHGDDDNMTNWEEYIAGTDPTDPSSVFDMGDIDYTGGKGYTISWPSVAGRKYHLEICPNLLSAGFTRFASDIPATPPTNTLGIGTAADSFWIRGFVELE